MAPPLPPAAGEGGREEATAAHGLTLPHTHQAPYIASKSPRHCNVAVLKFGLRENNVRDICKGSYLKRYRDNNTCNRYLGDSQLFELKSGLRSSGRSLKTRLYKLTTFFTLNFFVVFKLTSKT